jgi:hypothetical protein
MAKKDTSSGVPEDVRRFNAFLAEQRAAEELDRRTRRAESEKKRAGERVRRVNADPAASREEKQEAEREYREAVAAWQAIVRGDDAADQSPEPESEPESEPEPEPESDET